MIAVLGLMWDLQWYASPEKNFDGDWQAMGESLDSGGACLFGAVIRSLRASFGQCLASQWTEKNCLIRNGKNTKIATGLKATYTATMECKLFNHLISFCHFSKCPVRLNVKGMGEENLCRSFHMHFSEEESHFA